MLFTLRENLDASWVTLFTGFRPDLAVDDRKDLPSDGGGLLIRDEDVPETADFALHFLQIYGWFFTDSSTPAQ